ncbi:MAG: hypothetical protein IPK13_05270 [Deltaproteobacteria bacterium]|nr:hypothetical protein [Deltaproteobacteria bacterium]
MHSRLLRVCALLWLATGCTDPNDLKTEKAPAVAAAPAETATDVSVKALMFDNGLEMNGAVGNGLYVNGLSFNGLYTNGLYVNGLPVNGLPVNGLPLNGLPLNGLPLNGLYVNGLYVNGIGSNGLPVNGLPLNGLYVNGLPLNGLPVNGLPLNGLYVNGLPLNGLYVNGLPVNGLSLNGLPVNGLYVNGLPLNGLYVNGLYPNGLYVNGLPVNGLPLNGLYVNGSDPSTAIQIANLNGDLVNLTSDEEAAFETAIAHLVWCALPENDAVTIYGSDGAPHSYPGHHGLAPGWKTAGLVDDPNGIDDSEELRWCVEHYRATVGSDEVSQGIALNDRQLADVEQLLKYVVSCALDAGDSLIVDFPSGPKSFAGSLGLAPSWESAPLDETGQKAVTACLAARTNAQGTTVRISLRNENFPSLATSALERAQFSTHEGAFWGNIFGSHPSIHACRAEGGGPAGRLCTDGNCGFTPDPIPACSEPVSGGCDTLGADGNYTSCGEDNETIVLNTYLMVVKEVSTSLVHTCARRHNGKVACWGSNEHGQVGQPADIEQVEVVHAAEVDGLPDVNASPLNAVVSVAAGRDHSCAQTKGGELWCWGSNTYAQIGDGGGAEDRNTPSQVLALENKVASVAAGYYHSCAILMNGDVYCWGRNQYGSAGNGTVGLVNEPVYATDHAVQVGAGLGFSCALKLDGSVWCWGRNVYGQLGDGTASDRTTPTRVTAVGSDNINMAVGGYHVCVQKTDQSVWCWGDNYLEQTSAEASVPSVYPAVQVPLPHTTTELAAGVDHTCALSDQRTVYCWGDNQYMQLARFGLPGTNSVSIGSLHSSATPLLIPLTDVVSIMPSGWSNFVELADGRVEVWGGNGAGNLGVGSIGYVPLQYPVRMTVFVKDFDGVCDYSESTTEADCGVCGDGVCAADEPCACPSDCADPIFYRDLDGDGYGNVNVTIATCGDTTGYVANPSDCNDGKADVSPGAPELLNGLDDNCDGYRDENLNQLTNPGFDDKLRGWGNAGRRALSTSTTNCRSSGNCATMMGTTYSESRAIGPGVFTASVWVRTAERRDASVNVALELVQYDHKGVIYKSQMTSWVSVGPEYKQLSLDYTMLDTYHDLELRVMTGGGTVTIDDAWLGYAR